VTLALADGRRRKIAIADYLAGPRKADRTSTLVTELHVPETPSKGHCGWSFQKLGRTAVDIALVSVAAGLELDARGKVKWARIAFGAVSPVPVRATAAEAFLAGRVFDRNLLGELGAHIESAIAPITDQRASADYRREMSTVLARRALEECAAGARWN